METEIISRKPRFKPNPYECYRCNYSTQEKYSMRVHLYGRKRPCPSTKHDIELTDDIKEAILNNRFYKPPTQETITTNSKSKKKVTNAIDTDAPVSIVNNYSQQINQQNNIVVNTLNQYINQTNMLKSLLREQSPSDKLEKIVQYDDISLTDFDDSVEERFEEEVDKLDDVDTIDDHYRLAMTNDELLDIINKITSIDLTCIKNLNILFDKRSEKFKIRHLGSWDEYLFDSGINFIIKTLTVHYLSSYEYYLIRGLERPCHRELPKLHDCLENYYKFIATFSVEPMAKYKTDAYILYQDANTNSDIETGGSNELGFKYSDMYYSIKKNLSDKERMQMRKTILKLIRSNHEINESMLNKTIIDIIHADHEFLTEFMPSMLLPSQTAAALWAIQSRDED